MAMGHEELISVRLIRGTGDMPSGSISSTLQTPLAATYATHPNFPAVPVCITHPLAEMKVMEGDA